MDVEKVAHPDFAKIASLQEALQTIFPSLLDIFYHPSFDFFQKNRLFQQPQAFSQVTRITCENAIYQQLAVGQITFRLSHLFGGKFFIVFCMNLSTFS